MNDSVADLVRRHDPGRFLTALFAPPAQRDALLTLYAFDHELMRAQTVTSEPHLALIRLQWWREVVEGARRRHETAAPLGRLLDSGRLTPALLLPVIDAYEPGAAETLEDWRAAMLAGPGGIAVAAATLLSAPGPEKYRFTGAALGAAWTITGNRAWAARGRCLLPEDLLAKQSLTRDADAGHPGVATVLATLVLEGEHFLAAAPSGRIARPWRAAALPAVLARRMLRRFPTPAADHGRLAVIRAGLTGWI